MYRKNARAPLAALGLSLFLCLTAGAVRADDVKPPKGFHALFNGKDLANWKGLIELPQRAKLTPDQLREAQAKADDLMRAHWSVQDGVLVYDGKGQSLQTIKDYGNFELYVDWRIQEKGDSGIYVRGNPQIQIWDNPIGSGGLFNNQQNPSKPIVVADRPVGEWNTFHIKMVGDRLTIKLNGQLVVDNTPLENYWERGKPLPATGPIELQHHGNRLEFRNIFIKELPATAARAAAPAENTVTLELSQVPLSQVIQLLAASGGVEIVLNDPDGRIGSRIIHYIRLRERPIARALEVACRAADVRFRKDADGVYEISALGQK